MTDEELTGLLYLIGIAGHFLLMAGVAGFIEWWQRRGEWKRSNKVLW